jgi:hypothetical protein
MGLNKKTTKHLNLFAGGSFMHIIAEHAKDILIKIIDNLSGEDEKLFEEEPKIAEPKILLKPSKPLALAILDLEPPKEETSILNFMFEFEDKLFDDYANTSKYHMMKKPQEYINLSFIDPSEKEFFKKTTKELVSVLSYEWLEESELSPKIIHLDSPSIIIRYQLNKAFSPCYQIAKKSFRTHCPKFGNSMLLIVINYQF